MPRFRFDLAGLPPAIIRTPGLVMPVRPLRSFAPKWAFPGQTLYLIPGSNLGRYVALCRALGITP